MTNEFLNRWLDWLDSRPSGYSRTYLWQLKRGARGGADECSPLRWIVDQFIQAHPTRAQWVLPDPVKGRHHYVLLVDGTEYTYIPPRDVLKWAGMDEGTINAVVDTSRKATSHANFRKRIEHMTVTVRPMTRPLL